MNADVTELETSEELDEVQLLRAKVIAYVNKLQHTTEKSQDSISSQVVPGIVCI